MLKQIGPHEYEVTALVLDEAQSFRLDKLMQEPSDKAAQELDAAVERARGRLTELPLKDLLTAR